MATWQFWRPDNRQQVSISGKEEQCNLYDIEFLFTIGDDDCVAQVLSLFLKDGPGIIKAMNEAVDKRGAHAIYGYAHKLKGSAGIIKAKYLSASLERAELLASVGDFNNDLPAAVKKATVDYCEVHPPLQSLLHVLTQKH